MFRRVAPALALLVPFAADAAAPALIPVTGFLSDDAGLPIDDQVTVGLKLYTSGTAASSVWEEVQQVDVDNGQFTVYLGDATPLDLALFKANPALYLGIAVGTGVEMTPRFHVATAPYAAYAQYSDDAAKVGGIDAADLQKTADSIAWTRVTGVPAALADGDQDTLYTGGTGLTLSVAHQFAVDQTVIEGWARGVAYDSLTELRGQLDAVYAAKQGCPAGQVLVSDGTSWVCTDPATLPISEAAVDSAVANNGYATGTALTSLTTRVTTAETAITSVTGRVTTAEGAISSLTSRVSTAETAITSLVSRMTTAETAIALYGGSSAVDSAPSCLAIKTAHPTAADGTYWLNPFKSSDSSLSFKAYCLMSRAGGGWTKVAQYDNVTDLSPKTAVNAGGAWTTGASGAGKLSNSAISLMWTRTRVLLRMPNPSDGILFGNGIGYMIFAGHFTDFGTGLRPGSPPYSLYCEQTGDEIIDAQQNYAVDGRADCGYGSYWLYDHNYTGDPQCYGFSATTFKANLHFCGTTTQTAAGGVTGATQVFVRD
jgi:hypothetical protein